MKKLARFIQSVIVIAAFFVFAPSVFADALTLTSGNNATTTPGVATSITGFQIVGNAASTTPVKIHATNGTISVSAVTGVTISGNNTSTLNLSGTVEKLNIALSSITYTRGAVGTDTLEVALVNSNQIYFPDNGHVYQYVAGSINWNAAKVAAEALTAYGAAGYLVTITSAAENLFVKSRLSGDAWIGASDSGVEGTWKWVTGPEAGTTFWSGTGGGSTVGGNYASWGGGEPNNSGDEDCGETYVASGSWNDLPCSATVSGYVAEFGSDESPATVVSKNISIVTADVPAVTELSPSNGEVDVSPTADIVIGFSKTVTFGTGSILIKKVSDDSVVDTIDVTSDAVSGSGTSEITIDLTSDLEEGVNYYVVIPGTVFKDSSNNFFDGISGSTGWVFTTADETAPIISNVSISTTTAATASIEWSTNELASTKIAYSASNSFASSTVESDTSTRVTSHSSTVTGLLSCTSYNYVVVSADAAGNYATSTSALFTTTGCVGGVTPTSATTTPISVSSAGSSSLSTSGRMLTVSTPADFTATSSSVVIQIRAQESNPVLTTLGMPAKLSSAAAVLFDVTALVDNTTVLDSFDAAVTISYSYTDEDIDGLDENTLTMYHYHDDEWSELDDCSVDKNANVITCTTPSFSIFAIFGDVASDGGSHRGGRSIHTRVANLEATNNATLAQDIKAQWPTLYPQYSGGTDIANSNAPTFSVRDLEIGSTGDDVVALQKLLNSNGFVLAEFGPGSVGNETAYFGTLTQASLAAFQSEHKIIPSVGYFGPITRSAMKSLNLNDLWW